MNKYLEMFNAMWQVDFYRGGLCALGGVLAVLILYWILKIIIFCKFGRRRCSAVTVRRENGDIVVSADAVSSALRSELKPFSALEIHRVVLFCKRGVYSVEIRCALVKSQDKRGLPELYSLIEPLVKCRLADIFGLTDVGRIVLKVERSDNFEDFTGEDIPVSPELPDVSAK